MVLCRAVEAGSGGDASLNAPPIRRAFQSKSNHVQPFVSIR